MDKGVEFGFETMIIHRGWNYKNTHSFIYDQVRDCIQSALGHLNISFIFDINQGPEVVKNRGRLSLFDNKGLPLEKLKRNPTPRDTLVVAPISIVMRHWSLLIYQNERVFAYHTQDELRVNENCLKYAVEAIFGKYPITIVKNRIHQQDDFACGAFIIVAAIKIALQLARNEGPSLNFGSDEVAWISAAKTEATIGDEDTDPPKVEVPYKKWGKKKYYFCPQCSKKPLGYNNLRSIVRHLSLSHGDENSRSMSLARMARDRRAHMEERGYHRTEEKLKYIVENLFVNKG